ncbi:MAG: hypothetical protein WD772_10200, partial [Pseudohongiellaceae bacterium]
MSSPTFATLRQTLKNIRRRHSRLFLLKYASRTAIAIAVLMLLMIVAAAWLDPGRNGSIALFIITMTGVALLFWRLLHTLNIKRADDQNLARYVEDRIPDLEQRLMTSLEFSDQELQFGRRGVSHQFIQRLWQDAQEHVQQQREHVETVIPARQSWMNFGYAVVVCAGLIILLASSELLLTAGSRLAWPFAIVDPVIPEAIPSMPVEIRVEPGSLEMQRGSSITIVATISNARPASVNLRMQEDNVNWRDFNMSRDGSGSDSATYSYFIPALQEDVTYYVSFSEDGLHNSEQFQINLFDLPNVEQIDVSYVYPDYTGIEDNNEEDGGDMVVPEGTEVELLVTFNKAIASAVLEFDPGYDSEGQEVRHYENLPLEIDGSVGRARFTVSNDAVYRIQASDFDALQSRNPSDYFIRAILDTPPELVLKRPGRDQEVMPLEEVILEVDAHDDYGLSRFNLNYSVVGSDEVAVDFLPPTQTRSVVGNELIYLEDLNVAPGDFVSYYLTLADNNGLRGAVEVISDIYFLQVIPTDQEFRRSAEQGGGGGGGGGQGGDSTALVSIQKDIIAATWKLRNRAANVSGSELSADAEIIAESQREATERARMSIDRLAERLNFSDDSYDNAVQNLSLAIDQMNLAASELDKEQVNSALKPEQAALQFILKAEADINRTSVAMQQQGGGGGGGGGQQEREDLRELFEMELGRLENRYETPQSGGGGGQQNSEEANKLEELARRQEGLTRAQRNLARREDQMTEEQRRRELERLMRQQEQLSQEVAQLSQQLSRSQQGAQSSSASQQASQGGSASASQQRPPRGANSSAAQQQAQNQLQRAAEQMRQAAQSEDPSIAAALSQKALENLREQQRAMNEQTDSSVNQLAQNLSQRGQQLLQQQQQLQQQLENASRQQGLGQTRQTVRDDAELQALIEDQQRQQRELEEIEDMLRAIVARGDNEDQRLMSQAQSASRDLRPIREQMQTSNRVLRNGMVNLAVDMESEIETQLEQLNQNLQALNPANNANPSDQLAQAAADAAELAQRVRELQEQALAYNENGQLTGGAPSLGQMREQLQRSQQLAQQLNDQLQQQTQSGGQQPAPRGARGQQPGGQQQGGQQQGGQQPGGQQQGDQQQGGQQQGGQQGGNQQAGGAGGGDFQDARIGGGIINTDGNNSPIGNARSIRQQLTQQGIEDFLNQPE